MSTDIVLVYAALCVADCVVSDDIVHAGALLCAVGFISAIVVGMLDKNGVEQLGQTISLQQDSKKLVTYSIMIF